MATAPPEDLIDRTRYHKTNQVIHSFSAKVYKKKKLIVVTKYRYYQLLLYSANRLLTVDTTSNDAVFTILIRSYYCPIY